MSKKPVFRAGSGLLAVALGCAGLAGCQGKDPVAVGQQMGNRMCEQAAEAKALQNRANQQLLAELKAGTIKTKVQYYERQQVVYREASRKDSLNAAVIQATLAQLKSGFASPADAAVAAQQVVRIVNRCDSLDKLQARQQPRVDFRAYTARLTGPDPSELDLNVPPPPPVEDMHFDSATAEQLNLPPRP